MDADRRRGPRAPEGKMPDKGTRLASHIGAETRDKDVHSDRRNFPWSPENVRTGGYSSPIAGGYSSPIASGFK